ncbi:MAG: penicillin acylase family protein [Alphaproteobacteria bacterium]|nr:penicillin acylase family protein [Alphaproteobacteria bacterium]
MVEIRRDSWGVPHVFADSLRGVYRGYGFAVAEDRLFQMDMSRRSFTGRVADVLGADYLAFDRMVRSNYTPASIAAQIAALKPEDRDIFEGYAEGYNQRLAQVLANSAKLMPREYLDFGFQPTAITPEDVAMVWVGSLANRFSDTASEITNLVLLGECIEQHGAEKGRAVVDALRWRNDPEAPTTVPRQDHDGRSPQRWPPTNPVPLSKAAAKEWMELERLRLGAFAADLEPRASNIWLVRPERVAEGKTVLVNGPQFGWFNPSYCYGIGLHGPGFDIVGNTPFAYPIILFASNGHIAWGSTAGASKCVDIFQEHLNPQNHRQYRHNGAWHEMQSRRETIEVRGQPPVEIEVLSTHHGLVALTDHENHTAYAKQRSWHGKEIESLLGWIGSMFAQDHASFRAQIARKASMVNTYFADRQGNIAYALAGQYPDRAPGHDPRLPADGRGEMEWRGLRPFATNPQVVNPAQGHIANWNNKPAVDHDNTCTFVWSAADRLSEIELRLPATATVEQLWGLIEQTSLIDLNARCLVPHILAATASLPADTPLRRAAEAMRGWEGSLASAGADSISPGVPILHALLPALLRRVLADVPPREFAAGLAALFPDPAIPQSYSYNIPPLAKLLDRVVRGDATEHDFLAGRDADALIREALAEAVATLTAEQGPDPAQWRTKASTTLFRTQNFMGIPQARHADTMALQALMNRGTENNMAVLGADGIELYDVMPPGQSGFTAPDGTPSPHRDDQLALYGAYGRKRQWLTRDEALANTELAHTL